MGIPLSKSEGLMVAKALRFHADTMEATTKNALAELGKDAATKLPAAYAMIIGSSHGANDMRSLAKRIEEFGPGAKKKEAKVVAAVNV